jgi:hypothetical protein
VRVREATAKDKQAVAPAGISPHTEAILVALRGLTRRDGPPQPEAWK